MSVALSSVAYVDGLRLRRGLQAGIHRVISHQDHLNKINVFPVPDGDTGTNIAFTLNAVLDGLSRTVERHAGRLLQHVADAALDGARGNSGAIFAQFFQGVADAAERHRVLELDQFAEVVQAGAQAARDALTDPREGTLLSVLRDFGAALADYARDGRDGDFLGLLEHGCQAAEASLADTPKHLPVLRKAGVVDAGAEGFVDLLRGIHDFVATGSLTDSDLPELETEADAEPAAPESDGHRYCTECVICGSGIELSQLRAALNTMGSSLVVAGSSRKAKVHIHVDNPGEVFTLAERFGAVSGQKADDMFQQAREASRDAEEGVAIITDSGADLPHDVLERLNIHVVPVRVSFGSRSYLDKVSLSPQQFYQELARNPEAPQTSQPPPGDFRRQFQLLSSHYAAVVSVTLTEKVSGTYQAALSAAERTDGAAVSVLDSANVSAGQGLVVVHAAECAAAGMDAEAIAAEVAEIRSRTFTWGLLRDLEPGVRGGRVKAPVKWLADGLRLTPILRSTPDGRIAPGGVLFGRKDALRRFAGFLTRRLRGAANHRVLIAHANCPEDAAQLAETLQTRRGDRIAELWQVEMGCALGAHAGPGAIAVAIQARPEKPPWDPSRE